MRERERRAARTLPREGIPREAGRATYRRMTATHPDPSPLPGGGRRAIGRTFRVTRRPFGLAFRRCQRHAASARRYRLVALSILISIIFMDAAVSVETNLIETFIPLASSRRNRAIARGTVDSCLLRRRSSWTEARWKTAERHVTAHGRS